MSSGDITFLNDRNEPSDGWPFCEKCKRPVEQIERRFDGGRLIALIVRCHSETWEMTPPPMLPPKDSQS